MHSILISILYYILAGIVILACGIIGAVHYLRTRRDKEQAFHEVRERDIEREVRDILQQVTPSERKRKTMEHSSAKNCRGALHEVIDVESIEVADTPKKINLLQESVNQKKVLSSGFNFQKLHDSVAKITNEQIRALLRNRIETIEEECDTIEDKALRLTSLLGELKILMKTASNASEIHDFQRIIREEMESNACEILESSEWDEATQRVIRIEYTLPENASPEIAEILEPGLKIKGRLFRKQNVVLRKSSTPQN